MRLKKTEWVLLAVVASLVMGFGNWLQGEMNRAALARIQRDSTSPQDLQDSHGACAGMSARETEMMGKGELWCGTVGTLSSTTFSR
ncbi:hypothetical protein [Paraburkholderia bryophila]|uniref:Uncharacterized protein n=1 Tax=Paraburkholderia bryophila TaxID=420952 RepID=A0A329BPN4_9BURK|nr:hypothetical protein [Paraburkholderia bryophila]RAS23847.1 hypothetical protein BX591_11991 [Paraburkholderia bryophila]